MKWAIFVLGGVLLCGGLGWQDAGLIRATEAVGGWLVASHAFRFWLTS